MSKTTRNVLISAAVLFGLLCLCVTVLLVSGAGLRMLEPALGLVQPTATRAAVTPFPTVPPQPAPTQGAAQTDPAPLPTEPAPAEEVLSPVVTSQLDEIEAQVVELRGLQPLREVPRTVLTREELRDHLENELFADYTPEEAADDARILTLWGLVPPDFALLEFYLDLYTEQIAGFYDNDAKAMFVIQDEDFTIMQRMTYAHEFTHALQDMYYDFENGMGWSDEACEGDSERCRGIQAVIEGDATMTEQLWFLRHTNDQDRLDLQNAVGEMQSPVLDSAPAFFKKDLTFPYFAGMEFLAARVDETGFSGIDQAFEEPPLTSEQVIHPELYPTDEPQAVTLPDTAAALGEGWRIMDEDSLGEWYIYLLLGSGYDPAFQLEDATARDAAAGWDGDRYQVLGRDSDGSEAMFFTTIWDRPEDAAAFQTALEQYAASRWGAEAQIDSNQATWTIAEGLMRLVRQDNRTTWIIAPDTAALDALTLLAQ